MQVCVCARARVCIYRERGEGDKEKVRAINFIYRGNLSMNLV